MGQPCEFQVDDRGGPAVEAHATCDVTHGYDFDGNDLLGPDGRPAPQNCSAGPGACCDMVRPPPAALRQQLAARRGATARH